MGRISVLLLQWLLSLAIVVAAGAVLLEELEDNGEDICCKGSARRSFSLKSYCESWRVNVELNNVQWFGAVPGECGAYVGDYMTTSGQYEADVQRAAEEASLFLANSFSDGGGDGKDAWVFDVDDTLLSTLPYYKNHHFGAVLWCSGGNPDSTSLEGWKAEGVAPAIDDILDLYLNIKARGIKIFIISSRGEKLRDVTVDNLLKVGYSGWTELILRCEDEKADAEDEMAIVGTGDEKADVGDEKADVGDEKANVGVKAGVEAYKSEQRRKLVEQGYRILGIVSNQWSGIGGQPSAKRIFKLPNPMYYA